MVYHFWNYKLELRIGNEAFYHYTVQNTVSEAFVMNLTGDLVIIVMDFMPWLSMNKIPRITT